MSATELKKTYKAMETWLKKNKGPHSGDDEITLHNLNNLYFTWCGLRTACLIDIGPSGAKFAETFGLGFKQGPYFDIPGDDFTYFVNKKQIKRLEPLFKRLEEINIVSKTDKDAYSPKVLNKRIKIVGSILGFDEKCLGPAHHKKNRITIFFYTHPYAKPLETTEVFAYGCDINTPGWTEYPVNLMKESKKYLDPIGLNLAFQVMDWS